MPVTKYRDFESARIDLWTSKKGPDLVRRITRLLELSFQMVPDAIPRGIRKFRSLEEAQDERLAWTRARSQSMRKNRT